MSRVDTTLPKVERDALLLEIRSELPAFLSIASTEQIDPAGDVAHLLNLTRGDLDRVVAVHIALSDEIGRFIKSLSSGLRRPMTSSIRPRVETQAVRGSIDWAATIKSRAVTGWDRTRYVVRPARRVFDTPENRALVWLLEQLDYLLRSPLPADVDPHTGLHDARWMGEIRRRLSAVRSARRHHWLRGIGPERPSPFTMKALRAARTGFYKEVIPATIGFVNRLTKNPSPGDLVEILEKRYFEPERDWQLFELIVILRCAREFAALSTAKRKTRLLVGSSGPFAAYTMSDGAEVRLWYQRWPDASGESLLQAARSLISLQASPHRPDFIIERRHAGNRSALLLEIKASRSPSYLNDGLFQLAGYLRDRPLLFTGLSPGWLVAPASDAFEVVVPDATLQLWAVDSEQVARAAVEYWNYASVSVAS